mmetsp:Transcript_54498/g.157592  ORF Transcript_54498/g.157592 Transcript_54498/m.157592 type:complete len:323 (-) Transcript_54498:79-1047(-)
MGFRPQDDIQRRQHSDGFGATGMHHDQVVEAFGFHLGGGIDQPHVDGNHPALDVFLSAAEPIGDARRAGDAVRIGLHDVAGRHETVDAGLVNDEDAVLLRYEQNLYRVPQRVVRRASEHPPAVLHGVANCHRRSDLLRIWGREHVREARVVLPDVVLTQRTDQVVRGQDAQKPPILALNDDVVACAVTGGGIRHHLLGHLGERRLRAEGEPPQQRSRPSRCSAREPLLHAPLGRHALEVGAHQVIDRQKTLEAAGLAGDDHGGAPRGRQRLSEVSEAVAWLEPIDGALAQDLLNGEAPEDILAKTMLRLDDMGVVLKFALHR